MILKLVTSCGKRLAPFNEPTSSLCIIYQATDSSDVQAVKYMLAAPKGAFEPWIRNEAANRCYCNKNGEAKSKEEVNACFIKFDELFKK